MKAVLFDFYGTLLAYGDMDRAWADWLVPIRESLLRAGAAVTVEELAGLCAGLFRSPWPQLEGGLTVYECRLRELGRWLGVELSPAEAAAAADASFDAWHRYVSLDPDAAPVLSALSERYRLALVSNFDHPPRFHATLEATGLLPFFDAVLVSGEFGARKPSPDIFLSALERVGAGPHEAVHVGDAVEEDVGGATCVGVRPVLIRRNGRTGADGTTDYDPRVGPSAPDAAALAGVTTIASLPELLDVIDAMERSR